MRFFSSLLKLLTGIIAGEVLVLMKKDKKFVSDISKQKGFVEKAKVLFEKLWNFNKHVVQEGGELIQKNTPSMDEVLQGIHSSLKKAHDIGVEKRNDLDKTIQSQERIKEILSYVESFKTYIKHYDKDQKDNSEKTK